MSLRDSEGAAALKRSLRFLGLREDLVCQIRGLNMKGSGFRQSFEVLLLLHDWQAQYGFRGSIVLFEE